MQLLVSPSSIEEARLSLAADIIDVKKPSEGSLGANFPWVIRALSYADPLTYGVDGLRAVLIGTSSLPVAVDLAAMIGFALLMLFLGAYFFEKSESV